MRCEWKKKPNEIIDFDELFLLDIIYIVHAKKTEKDTLSVRTAHEKKRNKFYVSNGVKFECVNREMKTVCKSNVNSSAIESKRLSLQFHIFEENARDKSGECQKMPSAWHEAKEQNYGFW